ncbi:MAG: S53 family peptidase [Rhodobacter sp.]|nr:S53 family peptidase [Rhodobacter sp.]
MSDSQAQATETFPGWLPAQLARHYGFPLAQASGKGQKVAIVSVGGVINMTELANDFRAMRAAMPDVEVIDVDAKNITARQNTRPTAETHLDVEVIGTLCPEADIGIYRGPNTMQGFADAITAAVDAGNGVISISWAFNEQHGLEHSAIEQALQHAVAQNVTVCCSAGDGGAGNMRYGNRAVPAPDRRAHVAYPASSPNVLACGGTQLMSEPRHADTGEIVKVYSEEVWNNAALGGGAGGGGVSEVFPLPDWQTTAADGMLSANDGKPGRVVPDISGLAAYTGGGDWKIFENGEAEASGGTSAVAPLWASLFTLINELRAAEGRPRLGYLNERLYALAARGGLFRDVTDGHNRPAPNAPGYDARAGFDACTGWGVPVGAALTKALAALD